MSEPMFDTLSTYLEWRAAVNVSGIDPLPVQYSANQMFTPDRLMVSYYRSNNGRWTLINITATGNKITAKGKSNVRGKYVWMLGDEDKLPEWVRNFIASHKPTESATDHLVVTTD
jgi:hypothetical protein